MLVRHSPPYPARKRKDNMKTTPRTVEPTPTLEPRKQAEFSDFP